MQYPDQLIYPGLTCEDLSDTALTRCDKAKGGGEAYVYKFKAPSGIVSVRVAQHFRHGTGMDSSKRSENVLLAVMHKQLKHENILEFIGVVERMGDVCIVTAWHDEGDALSYLRDPYHHKHVPALMVDVSKGLAYLHDIGVIHGDLHGENVLIASQNQKGSNTVKGVIADFGYSVCYNELSRSRLSAMRNHCAPELADFPSVWLSPATDVFACASTFMQLLGLPLHPLSYREDLLYTQGCRAILEGRWEGWRGLIRMMWSERPDRRPAIREVQTRINKLIKSDLRSKRSS